MLCDTWMEVGKDKICGAEQKGSDYWRRIYEYFHEQRSFHPFNLASDHNENSLQHRWQLIQMKCNKFHGAYDQIKSRFVSVIGVKTW